MPLPPAKFPLRARYIGTDPVHGARSITAGGHATACLIWLDPKHPHIWCSEDAEVTCTECIRRMGPATSRVAEIPGTVGTLQERLAKILDLELPPVESRLTGQRVAEAVEPGPELNVAEIVARAEVRS